MPHNPQLIQKRNDHVRARFRCVRKKNPKWTIVAVIEEVAEEVFLSPATVSKILKQVENKIPDVKTVVKYQTA
jgi:predicted transcriptional regulator